LYFIRQPVIAEEEVVKLRKNKPKNLNINDLNPLILKTWVNYEPFTEPGEVQIL